ncbi:response regulator transcription factor [Pseudoalteromonas sp. CO348]|uniref:response regulator n=1 Tax=Pseudoalteromonas TaxID=53246 RepID=UPI0010236ABC|nr:MULTISPECIES: response regulator transcription factor [Pseudoalteromonas]MCG7540989.1 response regulator transcription factor [Pseudoalteromonas sp. OF7H-1]MCG9770190.1 response regulator transcription factor [Pseudoalteromonas piscicida]RZF98783.1 response regulator transcription factor [Pseudoalteromonas sp. CO348]
MAKISVYLVDDQALVRQGMQALLSLSGDIICSGSCGSGSEFIQQVQLNQITADIVLLDMRMPELDGVDVLTELLPLAIKFKVIILTTFNDTAKLKLALELGAKGCLLKDVDLEELIDAVRQVHQGELIIQDELAETLLKPDPTLDKLTTREKDILKLIAKGYSNKEIANTLYKAEGTIRNSVSCLLAKLQVRDRTQATLKAKALGFGD